MTKHPLHTLTKDDEVGYFAPRTWDFWRALIICFCLFSLVGHWLEIPYCLFMGSAFGIVDANYNVWSDPWYHPYWVYGVGAVVVTLAVEPLKEIIIMKRKTLWGALLESFVVLVLLSMVIELVAGWLINQPDAMGEYPYWDNSALPLNIFGQAWLVNDIFIGLAAVVYLWVFYPLVCEGFALLKPKTANIVFVLILIAFALCCIVSYTQLVLWSW
ncbi:putative ABC transporter permease [Adlercreutzia agrestimuris]|uniref:putative ABC transporter permease n=1 Tax=Adlercreutzia agrestimuris TaxID=2941324 RepID=UPI00203E91B5|nr:putative ABC transporter permease [Adlercreutzia agrestimuris]